MMTTSLTGAMQNRESSPSKRQIQSKSPTKDQNNNNENVDTFNRLYEEGKIQQENRLKSVIAKLEQEQRENTFQPNRELTKKADSKFKIDRSP